ncbi:MAG: VWA domain-containing protein [Abyssibacter sp.]|uniref:vWA domain-containing protein n=1 Tax=Abyssibacter sp. TaxID=2320200 RepID=UPI00321917D5
MIQLLWPWLLAALPFPWFMLRWMPAMDSGQPIRLPIYGELSQAAAAGTHTRRMPGLRPFIAGLIWVLLVAAACRPVWLGDPIQLPTSGRDLMLAVDVSGSMEEADMEIAGQRVNRLKAVQAVATDFIERRIGDRVGLILFGDRAYVYSPLSLDRDTVATLLGDALVGLAGQKTAIGDAIGLAAKRLQDSPSDERVLVLLTDGVNTAGELDPDKAAELAATLGIRIHTIGFGGGSRSLSGFFQIQQAQIDERQLQQIAEQTGGRYFRARDTAELVAIYQLLDDIEPVEVDALSVRPQDELYPWPLAAAGLLAVFLVMSAHPWWRRETPA